MVTVDRVSDAGTVQYSSRIEPQAKLLPQAVGGGDGRRGRHRR